MAQPRSVTCDGVVLRCRNLGEKDRIAVIFTRQHGKLAAVAKGARQPKSKLSGVSQPFTWARFQIARGRSLGIITQCRVHETFHVLHQRVDRAAWASAVVELADRTTGEERPDEAFFDEVVRTLTAMQFADDPELVFDSFAFHTLRQQGYLPDMHRCSACGRQPEGAGARFALAHGGLLCEDCARGRRGGVFISSQGLAALRDVSESDWDRPAKPVPPGPRRELRRLLQVALEQQLDLHLRVFDFIRQLDL